ncbi:MaoC family dehydratase [Nocardiopsis gilva YIM 90087]|uniref:UPF0336 protein CDO52_25335 n=1 Tax=Nocardiopsis gilva YIM 90087 TaxID=1235441 RepID=A0A223SC63_9ACTN|nr:MaoC family dehydratase N-terminal domain-containing protein [Nocardiopsis gilva]ASU85685.1 MaoC family dehydratase [Nocardiopsis gilva YIM 90087]
MAINRDFVGREYRAAQPYDVTRGKIREFAGAIQDSNALYTDIEAAKAAGYPDVIAPPTFPIILGMDAAAQAAVDPELGLDFSRVVHGQQTFRYSRPLRAGDVVDTVTRIAEIKTLGATEMVTLESEISTVEGEHVVTSVNMLVVRGEAAQDQK